MKRRIAVIGAGPIGLEAALAALGHGHQVTLYERGQPGAAIRQWGHVRMFSPFEMNASAAGCALVLESGVSLPAPESLLTGAEYVSRYLDPLATAMGEHVRLGTEVLGIARPALLKGELIGDAARLASPFQLLLRGYGSEAVAESDVILDCTGTFANPNPLGAGGISAPGERACAREIYRGVPDILGTQRQDLAGQRVLVVGAGHSAATVIRDLVSLSRTSPGTHIIWAIRGGKSVPCVEVENDPLSGRAELSHEVNQIALTGAVDFRPGRRVSALERVADGMLVTLTTQHGEEAITVDKVIASTGYRPDLELARELQVKICYATEGTFNLAAALLEETGGDCLAIGSFGAATLAHPEPGYFALGMKSYGRSPDFLIRTGREQIASVLDLLDHK